MSRLFEALTLPLEMKEEFCRSLLAEFGVDRVTRSGKELVHRCPLPWHEDRNPSARLNYEHLVFTCWSCASKGGLLWLISSVRGGSTSHAREWVLATTGLDGEDTEMLLSLLEALAADPDPERPRPIPSYSPRVLEPWALIHPWLTDPYDPFHPELSGRGIPEENVVALEVGYAEDYPLDDKGTTSERIIVPHYWQGKLVGWQSRRLTADGSPKWLSTPEFPRDTTLFHPPEGGMVVVVESPMTVLRHVHHLPIAATFGGNVTDAQIRLLADYDKVVYFPDPDRAGWGSLLGSPGSPGVIERLAPYTDLDIVSTDWSVDGADMDEETVAELVEQAVPDVLWEPPTALRCWACKKVHTGDCREEE